CTMWLVCSMLIFVIIMSLKMRCALFGEYVDEVNRFLVLVMLSNLLWSCILLKSKFLG
ncbi:hypothetical protein S245_012792, partial [Arachis hypogaea]